MFPPRKVVLEDKLAEQSINAIFLDIYNQVTTAQTAIGQPGGSGGIPPSSGPGTLSTISEANILLTVGGTPLNALLKDVILTVGWQGTLADARITSAATWNATVTGLNLAGMTTGYLPAKLGGMLANSPISTDGTKISISGQILSPVGTLAVPTYSFTSDIDSGIMYNTYGTAAIFAGKYRALFGGTVEDTGYTQMFLISPSSDDPSAIKGFAFYALGDTYSYGTNEALKSASAAVSSGSQAYGLALISPVDGANSNIRLYVGGYTAAKLRVTINNSGNVLIGTATDTGYKFNVNGTGYFGGAVDVGNNKITSLATPTVSTDAATKGYVDTIGSGLHLATNGPVKLATAGVLPNCTAAGSGVGKTLTADAVGVLTVDTVATVLNDRILVKNQVTGADNGIYKVTTEGTAGVAFILTRATDADVVSATEVTTGLYCFVTHGSSVNINHGFALSTPATITLETTALTFGIFSNVVATAAGANLDVQINASGLFGVDTGVFTYNSATHVLGAANATLSGTLGVTGVATLTAQPILSSLTASLPVFSDGSKGLTSNAMTGTGNVVMSASPTLTGTTLAANATLSGALIGDLVTDSTSIITGAFQTDGGLGVVKALWVGGLANIAGAMTLQSTLTALSILANGAEAIRFTETGGIDFHSNLGAPQTIDMTNVNTNFKRGLQIVVYTTKENSYIIGTDGHDYYCILSHTSSAANKPITGGSWASYWAIMASDDMVVADVWVTGAPYYGVINTGGIQVWAYTPPGSLMGGDASGIYVINTGGGNAISAYNKSSDRPAGYTQYLNEGYAIEAMAYDNKNSIVSGVEGGTAYRADLYDPTGGMGFHVLPVTDDTLTRRAIQVTNAANTIEKFYVTLAGVGYFAGNLTTVGNLTAGGLIAERIADDSATILRVGTVGAPANGFDFSRSNTTGALHIQGNQAGYNNIVLAPTSGRVDIDLFSNLNIADWNVAHEGINDFGQFSPIKSSLMHGTNLSPITDPHSTLSMMRYDSSGGSLITAGSFVVDRGYTISSIGTTDFTLIGAVSNTIGIYFIATGIGAGTGKAYYTPGNTITYFYGLQVPASGAGVYDKTVLSRVILGVYGETYYVSKVGIQTDNGVLGIVGRVDVLGSSNALGIGMSGEATLASAAGAIAGAEFVVRNISGADAATTFIAGGTEAIKIVGRGGGAGHYNTYGIDFAAEANYQFRTGIYFQPDSILTYGIDFNSITATPIRFPYNVYFVGRDSTNTVDLNILKINSAGKIEFGNDVTFIGVWYANQISEVTASHGLRVTNALFSDGAFGCNGATAQTAYASGGALAAYATGAFGLDSGANMAALHAMVVSIRAALVADGIMS